MISNCCNTSYYIIVW